MPSVGIIMGSVRHHALHSCTEPMLNMAFCCSCLSPRTGTHNKTDTSAADTQCLLQESHIHDIVVCGELLVMLGHCILL